MNRHQSSILSFLITFYILTSIVLSFDVDDTYIKQHSFKQPYLMVDSGIAFWEMDGFTVVSENSIELIPFQRSMRGSIWNSWRFPYNDFEIETSFSVRSNSGKVESGIGFWFTKEIVPSDQYYGAQLKWDGVTIIFEPNKRQPKFFLIKNEGEDYMTPVNMLSKSLFQCKANISNMKSVIHLRISYVEGVLSLTYQEEGNQAYKCFDINIDLPNPGYFGITAASGNTPVQYDVYSFLTNSYKKEEVNQNIEVQDEEKDEIVTEGVKINEDILDQIEKLFDDKTAQVKHKKRYTKKDVNELSEKIGIIEEKLNEYIHNVGLNEKRIHETLKEIISEKEKKNPYHSMIQEVRTELKESKDALVKGLASKLAKVEKDISQINSMMSISTRTIDKIKGSGEELNQVMDKIITIENQTMSGIVYFVVFEVGFILSIIFWRQLISALKDKLN